MEDGIHNHSHSCEYGFKKYKKISKKDRWIITILTLFLGFIFLKDIAVRGVYLSAKNYENVGDIDKAISQLKKAIRMDPKFALPYNQLGLIYEEIGKEDEALNLFKKAKSLDKNLSEPYVSIGRIYLRRNDYNGIVEELKPVLSKENLDKNDLISLKILAASYNKLGDKKNASLCWTKIAKHRNLNH